jgi:hypothetical protein
MPTSAVEGDPRVIDTKETFRRRTTTKSRKRGKCKVAGRAEDE